MSEDVVDFVLRQPGVDCRYYGTCANSTLECICKTYSKFPYADSVKLLPAIMGLACDTVMRAHGVS